MAFSKIGGKGIDLSTDIITEFNSTGVDDNATSTTITLNANNTATIPNVTGNTTFNEYITVTNLTVNNDASISNDLTVGGNFIITGNTFTVDSTSLKVEDSLIHLAGNNVSNDIIDIGFIGHYSNDSGNTELFTGFYRDATDEQYYLFNGLSDDINTATTIDKTGTGYTLASLNVGGLNATTSVEATTAFRAYDSVGATYRNVLRYDSGNVRLETGSSGSEAIMAFTGGSERMRIDADGNVGIGTNITSGLKLNVLTTVSDNLVARFENSHATGSYGIAVKAGDDSGNYCADFANKSGTSLIRIRGDGNVGIGITSPVTRFNVNAGGSPDATYGIANFAASAGNNSYVTVSRGANDQGGIKILRGSVTDLSIYVNAAESSIINYNGGDTNDGLFFRSGSAETEVMTLNSSGNVGIGTNSPTTNCKLHVADADVQVELEGTVGSASGFINFDGTNLQLSTNRNMKTGAFSNASKSNATIIMTGATGGSTIRFYTAAADNTTALERMRIDSSGRVGIGTTSPAVPLHIQGEGALIDRVSGGDPYIAFQTNGASTSSIYGGSSTLRFFADAATEAMRIDSSGRVGINTTPSAWLSTWRALQFGGNTGKSGSIYANAGGTTGAIGLAQNWYYNGSVNVYEVSAAASDYGQFSGTHWWRTATSGTAGTTAVLLERMRLTNAGNLLIGGSSAIYSSSQLELHGNPIYQIFRNTGSTAGHFYRIEVDTVPNFYVIDDNSTGVYIQRGNTSWSSLSDETLKENITDIGSVLSTIANYRTARFSWKNDPENTPRIGFIAQDWQTDFPEVISEGKDEKLGMNYTETIPILLKAIQELSAQVTELQAEVAALKGA